MKSDWASLAFLVVFLIIGLFCWVAASKMEADSYNVITGNNVSVWQAMWVELRVQDVPKNKKEN